jgi:capsular polysaccharide biosynthesis protein
MDPGAPPDRHAVGGEPAPDPPLDLGRLGRAVRRHARPISAVVVGAMVLALVVSMLSPSRYEATAKIAADGTDITGAPTDATTATTGLATSAELVVTPGVLAAVAATMPGETASSLAPDVSAAVEADASILDVNATSGDPAGAARLANAVASTFLTRRADAQRTVATHARDALSAEIDAGGGARGTGALATALRERLGDLAVTEATAGSDLRLAEPAVVPTHRSAPHPLRSAVLVGLAVLLLAVTAAVVRDGRDRRRDSRVDELAHDAGLPLLAVVSERRRPAGALAGRLPPAILDLPGLRAVFRRRAVQAVHDEQRALAEGAVLEATVRGALSPRTQRVILVCGVTGGDGAGLVATTLVRALCRAGQDAALLEHWAFGDVEDARDAARAAGHRYVLVPLPTPREVPELPDLAAGASAALIVGREGRTSAREITDAARTLGLLGTHVLGLVLTAPPRSAAARAARGYDAAVPLPPRRRSGSTAPLPAPWDAGQADKPLAKGRGNPGRMQPA